MRFLSLVILITLSVFAHSQQIVKQNGKFGIIDSEMHFWLDPEFDAISTAAPYSYVENKVFFVRKGNKKWIYYIDDSLYISQEIDTFSFHGYPAYIQFSKANLNGILCLGKNKNAPKYQPYWFEQTHLVPPKFDWINFLDESKPIARVVEHGKYGIYNFESNTYVVPCIFQSRLMQHAFNSNRTYYLAEADSRMDLDSLFIPYCNKTFSFPPYASFFSTGNSEILMYYCNFLPNKAGNIQLINVLTGEVTLNFTYFSDASEVYLRSDVKQLNAQVLSYHIEGTDAKGKTFHRFLFIDVKSSKMLHEITSNKFEAVYLEGNGIYLSNYPNQLLKKNKIGEISEYGNINWLIK